MKYLQYDDRYWTLDIEGDGLEPTVIWCCCCVNVVTGETRTFLDAATFKQFLKDHKDVVFVTHNGVKFDEHVINSLWHAKLPHIVDTLVLSQLYHPNLPGGHSLASYGERFKDAKIEFNDWSQLSQEMIDYCIQDAKLTVRVFKALIKKLKDNRCSEQACEIEHKVAAIIGEQQRNGFKFNVEEARLLLSKLRGREESLGKEITRVFRPRLVSRGLYNIRVKQDGDRYASYYKHREVFPELKEYDNGTYEVFDYESFNIGSPKQRLERLLEKGFKPTKFTKKGNPQVNEDALLEFAEESGLEEVKLMAEWLYTNGRANMIQTWLDNVKEDDCIHGNVFSCGAQSRRMKHSSPNTANIPGTDKPYGKEVRALWTARPNRVLVGVDASALEGMMLLHYLGSKEAWNYFVEGDAHQSNSDALKREGYNIDRKPSKNFFYAFMYGAGDGKLGSMYGGSAKDGARIREILGKAIPGLAELVEYVQGEWDRNGGILYTIDGGFVRCPSRSAALNYKLQPAGAILMKQAKIIADGELSLIKHKPLWVGDIHDEWQLDDEPEQADHTGKTCVAAIEEAAKVLKFTVPVTGEYSIGKNWAETH